MWNRYNVHKMIINIGIRKHEIGSGTKLYYLWIRGYSTWGERDTQYFYADCFYIVSSQPNQRAAPVTHKVLWSHPGLNLNSLVRRQELNSLLFLKSPKSSAHASGAWRHSHPLFLFFYLGFYFDICEWRILAARTWTPALMFAPN